MIIIVGAGLAGLTCARVLQEEGEEFLLLDKSAEIGGRVATLRHPEGYLLDRGFQICLDSYTALFRYLDLKDLLPCFFDSGAILSGEGRRSVLRDPFRHPGGLFSALFSPSLSLKDRWLLTHLSLAARKQGAEEMDQWDNLSVNEAFNREDFSEGLAGRLLRPFFEGVFLDPDLTTDASLFRSYFSLFARGRAFIPRGGMAAIPKLIASQLPKEKIRTGTGVTGIIERNGTAIGVALENGEVLHASKVVLATDLATATRILDRETAPIGRETTTLYFSSSTPLYSDKLMVLPGGRSPLVRHYSQISNINPEAAPLGQHLLAASVVGPVHGSRPVESLFEEALEEISRHEPGAEEILEPLHGFRIREALPSQTPSYRSWHRSAFGDLPDDLVLAGDHTTQGSIQGAVLSGEKAAVKALAH